MSKYISRYSTLLVLSLVIVASACADSKTDTLAQDTALNRDLPVYLVFSHQFSNAGKSS